MTTWKNKVNKFQKLFHRYKEKVFSFFEPSIGGTILGDAFRSWETIKGTKRLILRSIMCLGLAVGYIGLFVITIMEANTYSDLKSLSIIGQCMLGFSIYLTQLTVALLNAKEYEEILSTISNKFWPLGCVGLRRKKELERDGFYTALPISLFFVVAIAALFFGTIMLIDREFTVIAVFPDLETPYFEIVHSLLYIATGVALLILNGTELLIVFVCWSIPIQFEILGEYFQSTLESIEYSEMSYAEKKRAEQCLIVDFVEHHNLVVGACNKIKAIFWISGISMWVEGLVLLVYDFVLLSVIPGDTWWFTIPCIYFVYVHLDWCTATHTKSEALANSVYCSDWYLSQNASFKKSLLILLARLQKPECFNFGGFAVIHVETFLYMVKISYSICTLLVFTMKKFQ